MHERSESLKWKVVDSGTSYGRYLVAEKDLKCGEVIFLDFPCLSGPWDGAGCPECLQKMANEEECRKCELKFCSLDCVDHGEKHLIECSKVAKIFQECDKKQRNKVLTLFRMMTLLMSDEKTLLQNLCSTPTNPMSHITKSLTKPFTNSISCNDTLVHNLMGIRKANAKSLDQIDLSGIAIYPNFALMNHSCVPNTVQILDPDMTMTIVAAADIAENEEITTSYLRKLEVQPLRRLKIWRSWNFICFCQLCMNDKTAVDCQICGSKAVPKFANIPGTNWKCEKCGHEFDEGTVMEMING